MTFDEIIKASDKRILETKICSNYNSLLFSNIELEHPEKYIENEKKWMEFLTKSIKDGDFLLPVILYGNFQEKYEQTKIFREIESGKIKTKEITKEEIKLLKCYFRFGFLCDMMNKFGNFNQLKKDIIRYKKKGFYELKIGDFVIVKTKRVLKRFRYGIPRISETEKETEVIKILDKDGEKKYK